MGLLDPNAATANIADPDCDIEIHTRRMEAILPAMGQIRLHMMSGNARYCCSLLGLDDADYVSLRHAVEVCQIAVADAGNIARLYTPRVHYSGLLCNFGYDKPLYDGSRILSHMLTT